MATVRCKNIYGDGHVEYAEYEVSEPTEEVEELTYDELLEALAEAEYELCLWELGIHDDFETEEI